METIIGLGKSGCAIAKEFEAFPQYNIYMIDAGSSTRRDNKNYFCLEEQESHEAYEESCPPLDDFFKDVDSPCLFVLSGAGKISGASLRILSALKGRDVSILYIHPDQEDLQGKVQLRHNLVFGVLQEYARSGVFTQLYIVQNSKMEEILEDLPVIGYFDKINNFLVSAIHMVNVFSNTDSEFDTFRTSDSAARIATFGVVDVESADEKVLFDLKKPREKRYYYGVNRTLLETDGTLLKKIKEKLKNKLDGLTKISYGIFSTSYETNYGYCVFNSSLIQTEEEGEE